MGFERADENAVRKLAPSFGQTSDEWRTLQLRDEAALAVSLEKEFELFKEAQKQLSERALKQARVARLLVGLGALILFGLALIAAAFVLHRVRF